jgi:hypothetical protein
VRFGFNPQASMASFRWSINRFKAYEKIFFSLEEDPAAINNFDELAYSAHLFINASRSKLSKKI